MTICPLADLPSAMPHLATRFHREWTCLDGRPTEMIEAQLAEDVCDFHLAEFVQIRLPLIVIEVKRVQFRRHRLINRLSATLAVSESFADSREVRCERARRQDNHFPPSSTGRGRV